MYKILKIVLATPYVLKRMGECIALFSLRNLFELSQTLCEAFT